MESINLQLLNIDDLYKLKYDIKKELNMRKEAKVKEQIINVVNEEGYCIRNKKYEIKDLNTTEIYVPIKIKLDTRDKYLETHLNDAEIIKIKNDIMCDYLSIDMIPFTICNDLDIDWNIYAGDYDDPHIGLAQGILYLYTKSLNKDNLLHNKGVYYDSEENDIFIYILYKEFYKIFRITNLKQDKVESYLLLISDINKDDINSKYLYDEFSGYIFEYNCTLSKESMQENFELGDFSLILPYFNHFQNKNI